MSGTGHVRGLDRCPPALYQGTAANVIGDRAPRYVYGPIKLLVHGRIKTKSDRNIGGSGRARLSPSASGLGGSFD